MERREICKVCPHNTKNLNSLSFKNKVYKVLSKFYSLITFTPHEDESQCAICGCTLTFKTAHPLEICDDNRWKSIHVPQKFKEKYQ